MNIVLIHVPIDEGKKLHDTTFSFSKTMNFGLLSIGAYLKSKGHEVQILDFRDYSLEENINRFIRSIEVKQPEIIGLSCISGFSFPNLLKITNNIKHSYPTIPIIVGGKDHVGFFGDSLLEECKNIDIVVAGEGEETINLVLKKISEKKSLIGIPNIFFRENDTVISTKNSNKINTIIPPISDYALYPNLKSYAPSIEISRGCPFNCNFCVSSRTKVRKKPIEIITGEISSLCELYNDKGLKIYFETPNMLFSKAEIDKLIKYRKKENLDFTYRTETRVEYLQTHSLDSLVESGLKVIDLGLESGSVEILRRMNKTNRPEAYIESAEKILEKAYSLNLLIKLNILFYIGETLATIKETLSFLDRNERYIKAISAYPLIGFHCPKFGHSFFESLRKHGGSTVSTTEWKSRKMFPINSSSEFKYDDLKEISKLLVKCYQSETNFFHQKQYGYFSPQISYKDFHAAIIQCDQKEMPFFSSDEERRIAKDSLFKNLQMRGS